MGEDEIITFAVPFGTNRVRADKVLSKHSTSMSRAQIQRLFEAGQIWMDDDAINKSHKVSEGDCLTLCIPPIEPPRLRPVAIPLDVLYEDEHLIAVNKASGMVVHPGHATREDTLVHALLHHCRGNLSGIGGIERPGIVHRLDKGTSGVMVAVKSDAAFAPMSHLFSERKVDKEYQAIVEGIPTMKSGVIREPIGRHPVHRVRMAVNEKGRRARTDWEWCASLGRRHALLRVFIHTGRTHQIRVHLAHIGHPVAGDGLYGHAPEDAPNLSISRMFLHSHRLAFAHPCTGHRLELVAELPDEFLRFMRISGHPLVKG